MKRKLVARAKKGDKQAFEALMHDEKEKLYKMAFIYMKNENDALEVFQETVLNAFTSIHLLKEDRYFSTWITRILINTALRILKNKKNIVPIDQGMIEEGGQEEHGGVEVQIDLMNALNEIEEKYKTVLLLRYYEDYSVKQISVFLECPEGTVKTNIRRGLGQLKSKLKGVYVIERQNSII
ncbi:sigma-70 family RNA polymerase sigma factor [Sporosarcina sp. ACRSL]|uniref:sigma-70 family RNA polymerase sigma factor n=1 Tax=Sporosarcina sp. ACRSL TaxID=2918215 RepID=UPI001EF5CADA|nr:sigma-70 family RNA polymerase sigma factor [Sporosarcina sp. ACRSL]MCG7345290.1 sigma-70 family RNA polymerase sigma factor [Sporosarcina sp. ACRSL]